MRPQLKIGINLISIPQQKAGVGFLAINLSKELILKLDKDQFYVFTTLNVTFDELKKNNSIILQLSPIGYVRKIFWEQFVFSKILRSKKIDVLINVHYIALIFIPKKIKQITIIPDLTYQKFFFKRIWIKSLYINIMMWFSVYKSWNIIAISEFTKEELLLYYPFLSPQKIQVMYLSLGNEISTTLSIAISNKFKFLDIDKPFFLFVGTVEPTKNLENCVKAYKKIRHKYNNYNFVLIGKRGWGDKQDKRFLKLSYYISKNELEEHIFFTGYLSSEEVSQIYKKAFCLLFPSKYEGFGIPLLEAMAAKIPIITSNISSMPEVVGEAGLLVDPDSIQEISQAMELLILDKNLRHTLVENGTKRLQNFSWRKSAEVIESIVINE